MVTVYVIFDANAPKNATAVSLPGIPRKDEIVIVNEITYQVYGVGYQLYPSDDHHAMIGNAYVYVRPFHVPAMKEFV